LPPFPRFCPEYGKKPFFKILNYIKLHGFIPQKKAVFLVIAVRASNATKTKHACMFWSCHQTTGEITVDLSEMAGLGCDVSQKTNFESPGNRIRLYY